MESYEAGLLTTYKLWDGPPSIWVGYGVQDSEDSLYQNKICPKTWALQPKFILVVVTPLTSRWLENIGNTDTQNSLHRSLH